VPKRMQDATISIEDKTFWSNPGVDVGGIVRAFQANSASGRITQGGSTITQQLIKTRLLGDDPTFTRKIKEAILALEATRTFSKKQILEMYFNQIYYGNQAYGLKAAAATYLGGYNVYSSLDWNMQQLAEKEVRDHVDGLKGNNVNNAALITLDPTTGEILAYVGSYDYYKHTPQVQGDYDHAGIAYRQPGSTFKLFTYLTGMLKANMTASTQLWDVQFNMPDGTGKRYSPMD